MHKVAAIGTNDFVMAFRAAGVHLLYEAKEPSKVKEIIHELVKTGEAATILIGESSAKGITDFIEETSYEHFVPSIIVLRDDESSEGIGAKLLDSCIEKATGIVFRGE